MSKYNRTIILVCSDIHSGHTLGLCNPETKLQDDEGKTRHIEINDQQKYLWEIYTKGIEETAKLAGEDEIVFLHIGDSTHGNKYVQEVVGTRIADQIIIAVHNFLPVLNLKNVRSMRLSKGTGAHSFGEGSSDVLVSEILQDKTNKDVRTLYHGLSDIKGMWTDHSHHGPTAGKRIWLRGNDARLYLRDLMMSEIQSGNLPPRLVLRGHHHQYVEETLWMDTHLGFARSTLCVVPPMCLLGDFGRQVSQSAFKITNGVLAFEVINGKLVDSYFFGQTLDIRTKETI